MSGDLQSRRGGARVGGSSGGRRKKQQLSQLQDDVNNSCSSAADEELQDENTSCHAGEMSPSDNINITTASSKSAKKKGSRRQRKTYQERKLLAATRQEDGEDSNRAEVLTPSPSPKFSTWSKISLLSFILALLGIGIVVVNGNVRMGDFKDVLDKGVVNVKVFGSNFVLPDFQGVDKQLTYQRVHDLADTIGQSMEESRIALQSLWQAVFWADITSPTENPNDDSEDYTEDLNAWIQNAGGAAAGRESPPPSSPDGVDANSGVESQMGPLPGQKDQRENVEDGVLVPEEVMEKMSDEKEEEENRLIRGGSQEETPQPNQETSSST